MNITSEYLADLLIGIARAQNAIVDAVERAEPGFRSQHLLPVLTVAANMRTGDPRAIDLPSRILLRLQGRRFFNKDREAATRIMLHVHHHGIGECGVFTYEVAETKVTQVMDFARKHQHPLQCVMEKK